MASVPSCGPVTVISVALTDTSVYRFDMFAWVNGRPTPVDTVQDERAAVAIAAAVRGPADDRIPMVVTIGSVSPAQTNWKLTSAYPTGIVVIFVTSPSRSPGLVGLDHNNCVITVGWTDVRQCSEEGGARERP
jgi:hypothetical protein